MQINPTQPFIRIASLVASRYQDQIRRDSEVTLQQRFAALDRGVTPTRTSVFGGGQPITVVPDREDSLEQLWRRPARRGREFRPEPYDDPTRAR